MIPRSIFTFWYEHFAETKATSKRKSRKKTCMFPRNNSPASKAELRRKNCIWRYILSRYDMVSLIYKKGDPASCDNYRPISLLSIAYKVYAAMIKNRFLDAGLESTLWPSQFGFRTGCSTEDAIYVMRRRIETARAQRPARVTTAS